MAWPEDALSHDEEIISSFRPHWKLLFIPFLWFVALSIAMILVATAFDWLQWVVLLILAGSGADRGLLVAYITSWAILGVQRIIVWDIPFMGIDFSLLRFLIGLPLPIIAGMLARRLPFSVSFEPSSAPKGLEK